MIAAPRWTVNRGLPRAAFLGAAALALATAVRAQSTYATPYTFTTLAGQANAAGYTDGTGVAAHFSRPEGLALDSSGNLYAADTSNGTIRKITPAGVVSTLAGLPSSLVPAGTVYPPGAPVDGTGSDARFAAPSGIVADSSGNLWVTSDQAVRRVTPAGVVTTFAGGGPSGGVLFPSMDGVGTVAQFRNPLGIALDARNGFLYVADSSNSTIRKIEVATALVSTFAGFAGQFGHDDGTGSAARFSSPTGVAVDASGNVFVADSGNFTVRKITPAGVVSTFAGSPGVIGAADGTGAAAQFDALNGIAIDANGNLFVTDANNTIRMITSAGAVTTLAGTPNATGTANGTGSAVQFSNPYGVAVDAGGDLYVSDSGNDTVRERYSAANASPAIVTQPVGQSVALGASVTFSVAATGVPVPSYQWLLNGSYVPGGTSPTLAIPDVEAANLGAYSVLVSNEVGTVTSDSVMLASPGVTSTAPSAPAAPYFSNISTRAQVGTGAEIEIAGFVIAGPPGSTEQILLRGDGFSLDEFHIDGFLPQPVLTLFDSSGTQIATNSSWSTSPDAAQISAASASAGAFAFLPPVAGFGADSALLLNLAPGAYTAQITGDGGATGIALAEIYQVGAGSAQLTNISTRALVGAGTSVEIAGLVIQGSQPSRVLIRAVGPTLGSFSVGGVLAQPSLSVVDASGNTVATNTGWSTNANAAAIASETAAVGAFALPSGSADCALLLTLPPGAYTAIVSGVGGTGGVALVEAYQAP
jgi:sugar lactone lactonase YvrE